VSELLAFIAGGTIASLYWLVRMWAWAGRDMNDG
jgi:hypothetical protein